MVKRETFCISSYCCCVFTIEEGGGGMILKKLQIVSVGAKQVVSYTINNVKHEGSQHEKKYHPTHQHSNYGCTQCGYTTHTISKCPRRRGELGLANATNAYINATAATTTTAANSSGNSSSSSSGSSVIANTNAIAPVIANANANINTNINTNANVKTNNVNINVNVNANANANTNTNTNTNTNANGNVATRSHRIFGKEGRAMGSALGLSMAKSVPTVKNSALKRNEMMYGAGGNDGSFTVRDSQREIEKKKSNSRRPSKWDWNSGCSISKKNLFHPTIKSLTTSTIIRGRGGKGKEEDDREEEGEREREREGEGEGEGEREEEEIREKDNNDEDKETRRIAITRGQYYSSKVRHSQQPVAQVIPLESVTSPSCPAPSFFSPQGTTFAHGIDFNAIESQPQPQLQQQQHLLQFLRHHNSVTNLSTDPTATTTDFARQYIYICIYVNSLHQFFFPTIKRRGDVLLTISLF
ncbi:hypothetical protein RFI_05594, partial [Reticulomyxa filosa]